MLAGCVLMLHVCMQLCFKHKFWKHLHVLLNTSILSTFSCVYVSCLNEQGLYWEAKLFACYVDVLMMILYV